MKKKYLFMATVLFAAVMFVTSCDDDKELKKEIDDLKNRISDMEKIESKPTGTENGFEYVDLGLSVKWATRNVGAKKSEDYGLCLAWGETKEKKEYEWDNYFDQDSLNKIFIYTNGKGTTTLDLKDDAAAVHMGGKWRMPTKKEFEELINNCIMKPLQFFDSYGNVINGCQFIAKNGNSIFFPCAGSSWDLDIPTVERTMGLYWTKDLDNDNDDEAYCLYFSKAGSYSSVNLNARFIGQSVRGVFK